MNTNGILLYTRAYNAASTAAQPAVVAIQIGKGFKGISNTVYKSTGKVTSGDLDHLINASQEVGLAIKSYDEVTGILILEAGYRDWETDRKSTRLNSSHSAKSRMPSSA